MPHAGKQLFGGRMNQAIIDKWREDIDQLALELPLKHKNLFFQLPKKHFDSQIQELRGSLEKCDTYMVTAGLARIVASAGDAHTTLLMPARCYLPFEFYWFMEGVYIIAASERYQAFLYGRVTHIDGLPICEVIESLSRIISHENDAFLKSQLPRFLSAADILYGLEIIEELEQVELTLENSDGDTLYAYADTCALSEFHKLSIGNSDEDADIPLYRTNKDAYFWSCLLPSDKTLYFNYKSCRDMTEISVADFCTGLMDIIQENDVRKLVIDLRNNLGGNSSLLDPFIDELASCGKLAERGNIFVILGRDTFSSALLNAYSLKEKTNAVFIGEATGGKPNCYGEVEYLDLRNSGLKIRYSTVYYDVIEDESQMSFFPEIECNVTFENYRKKRDVCMEYALAFRGE